MDVIYQLTFFLALAVLAILVTIFVFAVSLLGRALERASKEKEKTLEAQKEATEKEIAGIQKQISKLLKKEHIKKELGELEKKLRQLRKQGEEFEKKISKIGKAPELLTVRGGVIPPARILAIALILCGVALVLYESQIVIANLLWVLGLAAIFYSVWCIYQSLKVIESVAITSEEAALVREVQALKTAFREYDEEKKPELILVWKKQQPPFHTKADSTKKLLFGLYLTRGDVADDADVMLYAPPGFSFPDRSSITQEADHPIAPEFVSACVYYGAPIIRGGTVAQEVNIKAPTAVGKFEAYYRVSCRGFCGEYKKFEIVVEEVDISS